MLRFKQRNNLDEFAKVAKPLGKEEMKTYVGGGIDIHGPNDGEYLNGPELTEVVVVSSRPQHYPLRFTFAGNNGGSYSDEDPYYSRHHSFNPLLVEEEFEDPTMKGGGAGSRQHDLRNGNLHDGISLTNNKNITLNLGEYSALSNQIKKILESNSILKSIASRFDKGLGKLTIGLTTQYPGSHPFGNADPDGEHIVLNINDVNSNGWNNPEGDYLDNAGMVIGSHYTQDEKLLVTLAHEIIHATHFSIYNEAMRKNQGDLNEAVNWLKQQGNSEEFIHIFFNNQDGKWAINNSTVRNDNMHEYMRKHDAETVNSAVNEYREDFNFIKHDLE